MEQNYKELEVNHTYLVRFGETDTINSVTILLVSKEAYHIKYNSGSHGNDIWELKNKFHYKYTIVEDISDLALPQQTEKIKPITMVSSKLVNCYVCRGIGTVPDSKSTAGRTTCPACNGARMIPETIELTQK